MNYWVIYNGIKLGPMSLEQIRAMRLPADTPVWHTGLPAWVKAADVVAIADTLRLPAQPSHSSVSTPAFFQPAVQTSEPKPFRPPMPPTYLAWSIIALLLCCLIPGVIALIYSARVEPRYNSGDYIGARKASESAQMWIIISVIAGLISIPFQFFYFIAAGV